MPQMRFQDCRRLGKRRKKGAHIRGGRFEGDAELPSPESVKPRLPSLMKRIEATSQAGKAIQERPFEARSLPYMAADKGAEGECLRQIHRSRVGVHHGGVILEVALHPCR